MPLVRQPKCEVLDKFSDSGVGVSSIVCRDFVEKIIVGRSDHDFVMNVGLTPLYPSPTDEGASSEILPFTF